MEWIIILGLFGAVLYFSYRSNKKQERETSQMRNSLEVGDEITTIGGIIGEIVKIKEETVTIETGKDRTKIRILRSAVRAVDVHAYEKRGDGKKPEPVAETKPNTAPMNKNKVKNLKGNASTKEKAPADTKNNEATQEKAEQPAE